MKGDWNGVGCYFNYFIKDMWIFGKGMVVIEDVIKKLEKKYFEYIVVYGEDNDLWLIGKYEIVLMIIFFVGVVNRGVFIWIFRYVGV